MTESAINARTAFTHGVEAQQHPRLRVAMMIGGVILLLALAGIVLKSLMHPSGQSTQPKTKISIIPTAPPPPPPPPPKDQPKPQEMKESPKQMNEPPKQPDQPPADAQLKMTGEAGNGPSAFGAGNINSDYNGQATGTGAGRMQFAFYSNGLQRFLQDELGKNPKLRSRDYRVTVKLWLAKDGSITRAEIVGSSGNAEIDETLKTTLPGLPAYREAPPDNMPQPIKIRISNRGLG